MSGENVSNLFLRLAFSQGLLLWGKLFGSFLTKTSAFQCMEDLSIFRMYVCRHFNLQEKSSIKYVLSKKQRQRNALKIEIPSVCIV